MTWLCSGVNSFKRAPRLLPIKLKRISHNPFELLNTARSALRSPSKSPRLALVPAGGCGVGVGVGIGVGLGVGVGVGVGLGVGVGVAPPVTERLRVFCAVCDAASAGGR
jgi:hypothetical protein